MLPHHLQRIQRSIFESSSSDRRLNWAYPYGLIDARLSNDDLENMRLRFDRLHAIMPSGSTAGTGRSSRRNSVMFTKTTPGTFWLSS